MRHDIRSFLRDALLVLALMSALLGCQRAKESPPPARISDEPREAVVDVMEPTPGEASVEAQPPTQRDIPPTAPEGLSAVDLRKMLADQRSMAEETSRELAAARDPEAARQILLRRKGEILKTQKTIRQSDQMTPAQKDSLLLPLEQESIRMSTRLLNLPR